MASTSADSLLETLGQHCLLEPAQLEQLRRQARDQNFDSRTLAQKLIEQGWLTPYQVNQLFQGRGQELVLGAYILLERLGEGGMGHVYKARHRNLGRIVALKLVRKERLARPNAVARFHREIRAAAQLNHPNIVLAYDADQIGDAHFFTMEYVDGVDLAAIVNQSGPLPVAFACDCIRQAALGLQHAHERGLVHRDIKPSNLLLSSIGHRPSAVRLAPALGPAAEGREPKAVVKILDLGLARFQGNLGSDSTDRQTLTQENTVVGTPDFMAPEQIMNARNADIRADLYSLGCTLYFLLTGRPPFPGESLGEKLVRHQLHEPDRVELLRPDVPAEVAAIVRKLMAKRPEERYQTPGELAAVLAALPRPSPAAVPNAAPLAQSLPATYDTVERRETTEWRQSPPRRRRLIGIVLAGVVALAVLVLVPLLLLWPKDRAQVKAPERPIKPAPTTADTKQPIANSVGMKLALIPAGEFWMGSPNSEPNREPHEGPQHLVRITKPFYMGTHEVTVGSFRAFVQATGYQTLAEKGGGAIRYAPTGETIIDPNCTWKTPGWPLVDDQPVVCVSRADALAFCDWLSKKEKKVYRLPTEAEWEYACRAGTATAYHFGNTISSERAMYDPRAVAGKGPLRIPTLKVGVYSPNAFGLHDMHGNVWEWCADWYDPKYYEQSPTDDPRGPTSGNLAIMRGGGFEVGPAQCRSAFRFPMPPDRRHIVIGFRVVCESSGP
jgi:formylglycine-generating enzyme required for sulfatase activity/tRNA A-37 threonylcarbamoyl transferase component Bud32